MLNLKRIKQFKLFCLHFSETKEKDSNCECGESSDSNLCSDCDDSLHFEFITLGEVVCVIDVFLANKEMLVATTVNHAIQIDDL